MKKIYLFELSFVILFLCFADNLCAQRIIPLQQGTATSIRGLSVVDDRVAWVSGSEGYTAVTADGGKTWVWKQVKGYEKADFRDIEAFSEKEAVIMSSGTPALILKTRDGGQSWQEKYRNTDTAYFFDAMDFKDGKHGYILGDPIKNKFLLMETKDGGDSWNVVDNSPEALPNEASFAASGTCLLTAGTTYVVTGGSIAQVDMPKAGGGWDHHRVVVSSGKPSTGAFSLAEGKNQLVVVGGDYANDKISDSTASFSVDKGLIWKTAQQPPAGFQSCVEYLKGDTFLSTGTPGSNLTTDGGKKWTKIDDTSYNVCRKAKNGSLVLLAGNNGKIALFKME